MDSDFDTPKASAVIFELSHLINGYAGNKQTLQKMLDLFIDLTNILGFVFQTTIDVPKFIKDLVAQRDLARKNKDWKKSDALRAEITEEGYIVDDTSSGTVIRNL